jgi:hypothetical protein
VLYEARRFYVEPKNFQKLLAKGLAVVDSIGIMFLMSENHTIRSFFNGLLGLSTLLLRR